MSLTSHLKDPVSPVHRFFAERFADVGAARSVLVPAEDPGVVRGPYVAAADLPKKPAWRLGDPVVVPESVDRRSYRWSTVGVAFDYRVRFFYPSRDDDHRVARRGAERLSEFMGSAGLPRAYEELEERLAALRKREPVNRGESVFEHELGALCVALALYEEVFRMGGIDRSPLGILGVLAELDDILSLATATTRADLAALAGQLLATQGALLGSEVVANPTFAGSAFLGGVDADLIAGRRLLDIKTVTTTQIERDDLWQILAYALLDTNQQFDIDEVGLYFSRHGVQVVWSVEDLLSLLAGTRVSADNARQVFEAVLRTLQ